jgi:hypothetical protein
MAGRSAPTFGQVRPTSWLYDPPMAGEPPKRSDDETEAETVKRRLIDAVRERLDEIERLRDI